MILVHGNFNERRLFMSDMDSILTSVKKLIGIDKEDIAFDPDVIMHINSSFLVLSQLGVGPDEGFYINDDTAVWTDFISNNMLLLNYVKTFVYLKAKLVFDPPSSSIAVQSMQEMVEEHEWRIVHENEKNAGSGSTTP